MSLLPYNPTPARLPDWPAYSRASTGRRSALESKREVVIDPATTAGMQISEVAARPDTHRITYPPAIAMLTPGDGGMKFGRRPATIRRNIVKGTNTIKLSDQSVYQAFEDYLRKSLDGKTKFTVSKVISTTINNYTSGYEITFDIVEEGP